jgi:hypothetical protein
MWKFTDLENHTCLILGDLNSGKTHLTQMLLDEAQALGNSVAVIDMAPHESTGVGGNLTCTCDYYTTEIVTPRLSGKTEEEVVTLAELNRERIDLLLNTYHPRKVLFINDVSIYLQRGNVEKIVSVMSLSQTCIINGYFGTTLGEDPFSVEEKKKMIDLHKHCDRIIWR